MRKIKHYQYNSLDFHKKVVNSKRNTKEDVDKKIKVQTFGKAEVMERLFKDIPGIELEKAEKIYSLINSITIMAKRKRVTEDDILKAYDALGLDPIDIQKGADADETADETTEETEVEEEDEDIKKSKKLKKSEPEEDETADDEGDEEDDDEFLSLEDLLACIVTENLYILIWAEPYYIMERKGFDVGTDEEFRKFIGEKARVIEA